jgi:hypothetical protein
MPPEQYARALQAAIYSHLRKRADLPNLLDLAP